MDFVSPPGQVSMKMPDGTVYYANRQGTTEVNNPKHIRQIKNSSAKKGLDMITEKKWAAPQGMARNDCNGCGFSAWPFTQICPRCGANLQKETNP